MDTASLLSLNGHDKDLGGGFVVRRLLPAARRRSVGPFVFFDHFGPVVLPPGHAHDVRPHPHIGLATVTYLFDGAMMHRDSLGTEQLIEPGAVNWMFAGRGIVHSERRPAHLARNPLAMHGLQLWVGLPTGREDEAPFFSHTEAAAIPETRLGPARVRVLAGEAFGLRSPVPVASPTLYLDIHLPDGATLALPALADEMALYPVAGGLVLDGQPWPVGRMAVLPAGQGAQLQGHGDTRLAVVGGAPLDGPRHMAWNFVHSRPERIREAAQAWQDGRFPPVPGETQSIPLPDALRQG